MQTTRLAILVLVVVSTHRIGEVNAQGRYTIAHPTPRDEMRPLSSDRPDMTESAFSIDPGHVQLETDIASVTFSNEPGLRTRRIAVGTTNVRIGLTPRVDFQIVLTPFTHVRTDVPSQQPVRSSGFEDVVLRTKINLVGNDSGNVGIGLLPFISIPVGAPHVFRGQRVGMGLAIPMTFALPGDVGLGAMVQGEMLDGETQKYAYELLATLTASHSIVGDLAGFVEVASTAHFEDDYSVNFEVHGGLTYLVTPAFQMDCGVYSTVVGPGDDVFGFVGFVLRH